MISAGILLSNNVSIALHGETYEQKNAFNGFVCMYMRECEDNKHLHKHGYALKQHLYPEAKYFFPTQHFYCGIIGFFLPSLIHTNFPF